MIKYFSLFLLLIVLGWGGYFTSHGGFYPVAIVNYHIISSRAFNNTYESAFNFYSKFKKSEVSAEVFTKEIRRASLDKLIENQLIYDAVSLAEVDNQVASVVSQNKDIEKGAQAAYGLSLENFKSLVLRPQAATEILQKHLKEQNQGELTDWLKKQKALASIWVLTGGLFWDGNKIVNK